MRTGPFVPTRSARSCMWPQVALLNKATSTDQNCNIWNSQIYSYSWTCSQLQVCVVCCSIKYSEKSKQPQRMRNLNKQEVEHLYAACVHVKGSTLSLLEVISDIISERRPQLINFDLTSPSVVETAKSLQLCVEGVIGEKQTHADGFNVSAAKYADENSFKLLDVLFFCCCCYWTAFCTSCYIHPYVFQATFVTWNIILYLIHSKHLYSGRYPMKSWFSAETCDLVTRIHAATLTCMCSYASKLMTGCRPRRPVRWPISVWTLSPCLQSRSRAHLVSIHLNKLIVIHLFLDWTCWDGSPFKNLSKSASVWVEPDCHHKISRGTAGGGRLFFFFLHAVSNKALCIYFPACFTFSFPVVISAPLWGV